MIEETTNTTSPSTGLELNRRKVLGAFAAFSAGSMIPMSENKAFARLSSGDNVDPAILNFALNLEYLEAEFYVRAAYGRSLEDFGVDVGRGAGPVMGGDMVPFETPAIQAYANEIARDEAVHVIFLRNALGDAAAPRPTINLDESFTAAAQAAGLIGPDQQFDAFANEFNFLLGAYIFEDVGVTAYKGAAPLITDPNILSSAAGVLAVEAYHASNVRTTLFSLGDDAQSAANAISDARDSLDGPDDLDQGITIGPGNVGNIVPADLNGVAFSRTPSQVLNIVYLNPDGEPGGFFPEGVNGDFSDLP